MIIKETGRYINTGSHANILAVSIKSPKPTPNPLKKQFDQ